MDEFAIRNFTVDWYTLGRKFMPNLRSPMFGRYVGQSLALAHKTIGVGKPPYVNAPKNLVIQLSREVPTAAMDLRYGTLLLGSKMFTDEPYVERFGDSAKIATEELAIGTINGLIVHEALHFLHTKPESSGDLVVDLEGVDPTGAMQDKYGLNLCLSMMNIIEDIYIEARLDKPVLRSWLNIAHEVLISEKWLDSVADNEEGHEPIIQAVNAAGAFKNVDLRNHRLYTDVVPKAAVDILHMVSDNPLNYEIYQHRIKAALNFLRLFDPPANPDSDDAPAACQVAGVSSAQKGAITMPMIGSGEGTEPGDGDPGDGDGSGEMDDQEFGRLADTIERAAEAEVNKNQDTVRVLLNAKTGEEGEWLKPELLDVYETPSRGFAQTPIKNEKNFSFVRDLIALRSDNRAPGPARKTGSHLVVPRLTRIVTDGKIMAKSDGTDKRSKRMEVIILADCSGSMSGGLLRMVFGVLEDMTDALRQANIAHALYGHTTRVVNDQPFVFHVFSFDMGVTHLDHERRKRLERMQYIETVENYDGVAIELVSEQFTGRDAMRYIFVLSDGLPAGPGYRGSHGVMHTMNVVNALRARRINVIAISLVPHVVEPNNRIYGRENNIDASKDLAGEFRRVITQIANTRNR